ncbi:ATP-dependent protease [Shigella sonnei]|uniref:magnesium chelatase subunit ChlI family protein n=1 Tax=Shigella sonnei TaxID=624 RepID=UPI00094314DD
MPGGGNGISSERSKRLLKVARTIADIDQSDIITRQHLQEAVSYRAIDRLLIHLQKLLT